MRTTLCLVGMCCLLLLALVSNGGCTRYQPPADKGKEGTDEPETGPHGGWLAELGDTEEFHAELKLNENKKEAIVYILDGKAKDGVIIEEKEIVLEIKSEKPPLQVNLQASPEKGEKGSVFVGTHEKFAEKLDRGKIEVSGIMMKGKPLQSSTFAHEHK